MHIQEYVFYVWLSREQKWLWISQGHKGDTELILNFLSYPTVYFWWVLRSLYHSKTDREPSKWMED